MAQLDASQFVFHTDMICISMVFRFDEFELQTFMNAQIDSNTHSNAVQFLLMSLLALYIYNWA